jgi:LuxR family maltose regulon positive regulatory protein
MIARSLNMAEPTMKFHLRHIYAKLGVSNRAAAVAVAKQCKFLD